MGRSVSITITLEVELEVPKSWSEEDVADKVGELLTVDVKSTAKKVIVGDMGDLSIECDSYYEDE